MVRSLLSLPAAVAAIALLAFPISGVIASHAQTSALVAFVFRDAHPRSVDKGNSYALHDLYPNGVTKGDSSIFHDAYPHSVSGGHGSVVYDPYPKSLSKGDTFQYRDLHPHNFSSQSGMTCTGCFGNLPAFCKSVKAPPQGCNPLIP